MIDKDFSQLVDAIISSRSLTEHADTKASHLSRG